MESHVYSQLIRRKELVIEELVTAMSEMERTPETLAEIANMSYEVDRLNAEVAALANYQKDHSMQVIEAVGEDGSEQTWLVVRAELIEEFEERFDLVCTPSSPIGIELTRAIEHNSQAVVNGAAWNLSAEEEK